MITSLDRTHAGFYRCIVRNRMGALLQRQTEVQVACEYNADLGRVGGGREAGEDLQSRHPSATRWAEPSPGCGFPRSLGADGSPSRHLGTKAQRGGKSSQDHTTDT